MELIFLLGIVMQIETCCGFYFLKNFLFLLNNYPNVYFFLTLRHSNTSQVFKWILYDSDRHFTCISKSISSKPLDSFKFTEREVTEIWRMPYSTIHK